MVISNTPADSLVSHGLKTLGVIFAVFTILASLGGGNMFQSNQTFELSGSSTFEGLTLCWLGMGFPRWDCHHRGIRRIGEVTSKLFLHVCLLLPELSCIILSNVSLVPVMFLKFSDRLFSEAAWAGGFIGVLTQGVKRASFSNEAGFALYDCSCCSKNRQANSRGYCHDRPVH